MPRSAGFCRPRRRRARLAAAGAGAAARRRSRPRSASSRRCASRSPSRANIVGRIQATDRVNLVARVTAFLDQRFFTEGAEVKKGDLLYRLEQGPFQADVAGQAGGDRPVQGAAAERRRDPEARQGAAQHARPGSNRPSTPRSPTSSSLEAQLHGAQAQLAQSQINLDYTEIRAPIDGKIGRTALTVGNYRHARAPACSPPSSARTRCMCVFPVSVRTVLDLRQRYAAQGRLRRRRGQDPPAGRPASTARPASSISSTTRVAGNTDTITLRARHPQPALAGARATGPARELVDGELVTVDPRGRAAGRGARPSRAPPC